MENNAAKFFESHFTTDEKKNIQMPLLKVWTSSHDLSKSVAVKICSSSVTNIY